MESLATQTDASLLANDNPTNVEVQWKLLFTIFVFKDCLVFNWKSMHRWFVHKIICGERLPAELDQQPPDFSCTKSFTRTCTWVWDHSRVHVPQRCMILLHAAARALWLFRKCLSLWIWGEEKCWLCMGMSYWPLISLITRCLKQSFAAPRGDFKKQFLLCNILENISYIIHFTPQKLNRTYI